MRVNKEGAELVLTSVADLLSFCCRFCFGPIGGAFLEGVAVGALVADAVVVVVVMDDQNAPLLALPLPLRGLKKDASSII